VLKRKQGSWTPVPMTNETIDLINAKADAERKNLRAGGTFRLGKYVIADEVDDEEELLEIPERDMNVLPGAEPLDLWSGSDTAAEYVYQPPRDQQQVNEPIPDIDGV